MKNRIRYTDVYDYELDVTHPHAAIVTTLPDPSDDFAFESNRPVAYMEGDDICIYSTVMYASEAEELAAWLLAVARKVLAKKETR